MSYDLSRRQALLATGLLVAGATAPTCAWAQDNDDESDLEDVAEDAAIWGLPLVQTGRYITLARAKGIKWNQLYLNQTLATPALRVPGPNVDTIYGFAWLDLSAGPVVLDVPDAGDRYYSFQFMDAYENTFAYVGRRATGTSAGTFVIAGPDWDGSLPTGAKRIDAPTNAVLVLTRTLVKGPKDLPAAQALQDAYTLSPLANYPAGKKAGVVEANVLNILPAPDLGGSAGEFFDELNSLVTLYPPRGQELAEFRKFSALRLGRGFSRNKKLSPNALQEALERALQRVKAAKVSEDDDGWRVNYHITNFIADPLLRAGVNQFGPGANIAEEALYFTASHDSDGQLLDGSQRYSITFPKGQLPPVDAFWSLILYGADFFLVDNPIDRYSINDRTEGLQFDSDGALRIIIQHNLPANAANWLPAPAGPFKLILRTYQPGPELLARRYKAPYIVRLAA
jgi:hypothetical protein